MLAILPQRPNAEPHCWLHILLPNSGTIETDILTSVIVPNQIKAANGTTESDILSFVTAPAAGTDGEFSAILLNDMGYTNAQGTHRKMLKMIEEEGIAFALHGGDISYADDFTYGILPCIEDYHCYNGKNSTKFPAGYEDPVYSKPLPAGEIPDYGGPYGGDVSTIYESNWDIWQRWMSDITTKIVSLHLLACYRLSSLRRG